MSKDKGSNLEDSGVSVSITVRLLSPVKPFNISCFLNKLVDTPARSQAAISLTHNYLWAFISFRPLIDVNLFIFPSHIHKVTPLTN